MVSVVLTSLLEVEDVDGPVTLADLVQTVRDGVTGDPRGVLRRLDQRQTSGQAGAECRRMGAPGPVRRAGVVPLDRDLDVLATVEEVVDRLPVPAGDDHRRRPESVDALRHLRLSNSLLLVKNGGTIGLLCPSGPVEPCNSLLLDPC